MFEQDYIMREVQKMVQMIQDIIGLKKEKKLDQALQKIGEGYDQFFDLEPDEITSDNFSLLEKKCTDDGKFSPDLAFALADMIYEEAELLNEQDKSEQAMQKYELVLKLYRRAINEKGAAVPLNTAVKMNELEERLNA